MAGTHWSAWSETEIPEGTKIKVVEVKGMTLKVTNSLSNQPNIRRNQP
ncbi:NfeD family protein [candidate division TA06 bacterium]|nr:NfeD family protein [candidate division TA06 bacterium]